MKVIVDDFDEENGRELVLDIKIKENCIPTRKMLTRKEKWTWSHF